MAHDDEPIVEALAAAGNDPKWLCEQLERWPHRVHPHRTTSIRHLDETASAIITAASIAENLPAPLDAPMLKRLEDALAGFRRQHAGRE